MNSRYQNYEEKDWVDTTAAFAPAVLGAAAGMLLSEALSERTRKPVGLSLGCIGLAALTPLLVNAVINKVNGPRTVRGSQRTLQGIRDAGLPAEGDAFLDDGVVADELGVG